MVVADVQEQFFDHLENIDNIEQINEKLKDYMRLYALV